MKIGLKAVTANGAATAVLLAALPAFANVDVTLDFASLPSAQGWTFVSAGPVAAEADVFSVTGGVLAMAAGGGGADYYKIDGVIDAALSFELTARARALDGGISLAFYFGVGTNYGGMHLTPTEVLLSTPSDVQTLTAIDNTVFHDYRVVGDFGSSGYQVFIDGAFVGNGAYVVTAEPFQLVIGDAGDVGGRDSEGTAQLSAYSFRQPAAAIPEPATYALMLVGIVAVGAVTHRRKR